jgi:hypothetical protein
VIPEGKPGGGTRAWVFTDEIQVYWGLIELDKFLIRFVNTISITQFPDRTTFYCHRQD